MQDEGLSHEANGRTSKIPCCLFIIIISTDMHVIITSGGIKSHVHPVPVLYHYILLAIMRKMNTRCHVICIILFYNTVSSYECCCGAVSLF